MRTAAEAEMGIGDQGAGKRDTQVSGRGDQENSSSMGGGTKRREENFNFKVSAKSPEGCS